MSIFNKIATHNNYFYPLKLSIPTWIIDAAGHLFCYPIFRNCHIKNQSARAFLILVCHFTTTRHGCLRFTRVSQYPQEILYVYSVIYWRVTVKFLSFSLQFHRFFFPSVGSVLLNLNMKKKREDAVLCASDHTRTICTYIRLSLATWTACKERPSILLHSTILLVLLFLIWFFIHSSVSFVLIMIDCERRYQKGKNKKT